MVEESESASARYLAVGVDRVVIIIIIIIIIIVNLKSYLLDDFDVLIMCAVSSYTVA